MTGQPHHQRIGVVEERRIADRTHVAPAQPASGHAVERVGETVRNPTGLGPGLGLAQQRLYDHAHQRRRLAAAAAVRLQLLEGARNRAEDVRIIRCRCSRSGGGGVEELVEV